jgi:hypothetical protein
MKLYKVHQKLNVNPLADVEAEVRRQLDGLTLKIKPGAQIAITAGSRGISNIAPITRAIGDWCKDQGAQPFLFPSMGSHNGATAEGQRSMIESLGLTEAAMGMPIRASMDVVELGEVSSGKVYMDKHAYESDGVIVANRIKLHTCFAGPVQSGLLKMMVVGMGKIKSATTFHSAPDDLMKEMVVEMGQLIIESGKLLAGLAILEDGNDQTAEIHGLRPEDIVETEPQLVKKHREYFPALPVDDLNVLIVGEIGKVYSGTGFDTNVIGFRGNKECEDLGKPNIKILAALDLAAKSQGNALGVGLADFITQRLRDKIDEKKTLINTLATGLMHRAHIPATLADDRELVETIADRFGPHRWIFIPNTLHLETIYVSEDFVDELLKNPSCDVESTPCDLTYRNGEMQLSFD